MKKLIILFLLFGLYSCNNPLNKKYSEETVKQDLRKIKESGKLNNEEAELLMGRILATAFSEESLEGKTYKEIIQSAKEYKEEQEKLKKEELEKHDKLQAELKNTVVVALTSKEVKRYGYDTNLVFGFAIKNTSNKSIDALKFEFEFVDKLGDVVGEQYSAGITDVSIKPGETFSEKYLYRYNEFIDEDVKLGNAEFENLKQNVKILKVVFSDGTFIE